MKKYFIAIAATLSFLSGCGSTTSAPAPVSRDGETLLEFDNSAYIDIVSTHCTIQNQEFINEYFKKFADSDARERNDAQNKVFADKAQAARNRFVQSRLDHFKNSGPYNENQKIYFDVNDFTVGEYNDEVGAIEMAEIDRYVKPLFSMKFGNGRKGLFHKIEGPSYIRDNFLKNGEDRYLGSKLTTKIKRYRYSLLMLADNTNIFITKARYNHVSPAYLKVDKSTAYKLARLASNEGLSLQIQGSIAGCLEEVVPVLSIDSGKIFGADGTVVYSF